VKDLVTIFLVALGAALTVALPGWLVLRALRRRSITIHIFVLIGVTVLAVLAGVVGVAEAMFISEHDLQVLTIVVGLAGVVSVGVGLWLGRRLAADAMWAAEARSAERRIVSRRFAAQRP